MLDLMYEIPSRDDVEECIINDEVIEQGLGESGTFGRIGARAQFVEQHETARAGRVDDAHDRAHVAGERRQGLGDRLLVADVGEDVLEDRQTGSD